MKQENPSRFDPKVYPLGGSALTLDFGKEISVDANTIAVSLSDALYKDPFRGFIESFPAYSSVTVFYDPLRAAEFRKRGQSCFDAVKAVVLDILSGTTAEEPRSGETLEIPVDFSPKFAPDLEFVAKMSGLEKDAVVELFTACEYRVFMLGFLPGFPYMASVDPRIAAPRHDTPRKNVPKGSVGIAGRQTGIYPIESPGGWRLIGRTDVEIFLRGAETPALFAPGDKVRFVRA